MEKSNRGEGEVSTEVDASGSARQALEGSTYDALSGILAELAAARGRDAEILAKLENIEHALSRIIRDEARTYSALVQEQQGLEHVRQRLDRIELDLRA